MVADLGKESINLPPHDLPYLPRRLYSWSFGEWQWDLRDLSPRPLQNHHDYPMEPCESLTAEGGRTGTSGRITVTGASWRPIPPRGVLYGMDRQYPMVPAAAAGSRLTEKSSVFTCTSVSLPAVSLALPELPFWGVMCKKGCNLRNTQQGHEARINRGSEESFGHVLSLFSVDMANERKTALLQLVSG